MHLLDRLVELNQSCFEQLFNALLSMKDNRIMKLLIVLLVEGCGSGPVRFCLADPLRHCAPGFSHAEPFRDRGLHG